MLRNALKEVPYVTFGFMEKEVECITKDIWHKSPDISHGCNLNYWKEAEGKTGDVLPPSKYAEFENI